MEGDKLFANKILSIASLGDAILVEPTIT